MKRQKIIYRVAQAVLVLSLALAFNSCKKSASISTDPLEVDTVFSFVPSHGYPGTAVKITGNNLSGVVTVAIGSKEAKIVSNGEIEISVEVPVGALTGKMVLIKENQVMTSLTNFVVDESPVPTIMDFSPAIVGASQNVIISGSLLDLVDSIFIGEMKVENIVSQTASSIELVTPAGMQTGAIKMYYQYITSYGMEQTGATISDSELTLKLPTIESISPDSGPFNIGDTLTLTGSMFKSIDTIYFGSIGASKYTLISDDTLTVIIPEGVTNAAIILVVKDGQTESSSPIAIFLPTISSFLPTKGDDITPNKRTIAVVGTNFSTVTGVRFAGQDVALIAKTNTHLSFESPGGVGGSIELITANGVVMSSDPFLLTGEMPVANWDDVFVPSRFLKIDPNGLGTFVADTIDDNGNKYFQMTMGGAIGGKSIYMWGAETGTDDRFSLFTSNPNGVYLEFDMKVSDVPDTMKVDGKFQFKIYTMDAKGWGAAGEFSYGANGPTSLVDIDGEWHHFKFHLDDFLASDNSGLYTVQQSEGVNLKSEAFCHPNSLRIISMVFGAANQTGVGNAVVGLDNLKFSIE